MKKKIVKREYKMVSVNWGPCAFEAGSGLTPKVRRLYYTCACGKRVIADRWKKHTHEE